MMHKQHNEDEFARSSSPSRLHATTSAILSTSSPKMETGRNSVLNRPTTSLHYTPSSNNDSADAQSISESDVLLAPSSQRHSCDDDQQNNRDDAISFSEENSPLKFKLIALLCALLLAFGSHYASHTLGTLKGKVKEELGITNAEYGVLQSSVAIAKTFLPALGGILVDKFGTGLGSTLATSLIALGNILVAASTNLRSFKLMILGRVMYGLGSGSILIVQGTILSHWFRGRGLAITLGMETAVSRLASFLSVATVTPIAEYTGFYGWAFWFAAFLCLCSTIVNLIYIMLLRYLRVEMGYERQGIAHRKAFHPRVVLRFPMLYWWIIGFIFVLGSGWTTFLHTNTEMVKLRYGYEDRTAATIASISQILPVFVAPFQGYFHDRYGRRATIAIIASITFVLSMWIFLEHTNIHPVVGMIIFSISLTFGHVAMFSSVPLTLAKAFVGTGLGIYKAAHYVGASLFDIVVGMLQDYGRHQKEKTGHGDEYEPVLKLYVVLGLIGLTFAIFVYLADSRHKLESGTRHHILLAEKEKIHHDEETTLDQATTTYQSIPQDERTSTSPILPPVKWYNYVAISLLGIALITSWILFAHELITKGQ